MDFFEYSQKFEPKTDYPLEFYADSIQIPNLPCYALIKTHKSCWVPGTALSMHILKTGEIFINVQVRVPKSIGPRKLISVRRFNICFSLEPELLREIKSTASKQQKMHLDRVYLWFKITKQQIKAPDFPQNFKEGVSRRIGRIFHDFNRVFVDYLWHWEFAARMHLVAPCSPPLPHKSTTTLVSSTKNILLENIPITRLLLMQTKRKIPSFCFPETSCSLEYFAAKVQKCAEKIVKLISIEKVHEEENRLSTLRILQLTDLIFNDYLDQVNFQFCQQLILHILSFRNCRVESKPCEIKGFEFKIDFPLHFPDSLELPLSFCFSKLLVHQTPLLSVHLEAWGKEKLRQNDYFTPQKGKLEVLNINPCEVKLPNSSHSLKLSLDRKEVSKLTAKMIFCLQKQFEEILMLHNSERRFSIHSGNKHLEFLEEILLESYDEATRDIFDFFSPHMWILETHLIKKNPLEYLDSLQQTIFLLLKLKEAEDLLFSPDMYYEYLYRDINTHDGEKFYWKSSRKFTNVFGVSIGSCIRVFRSRARVWRACLTWRLQLHFDACVDQISQIEQHIQRVLLESKPSRDLQMFKEFVNEIFMERDERMKKLEYFEHAAQLWWDACFDLQIKQDDDTCSRYWWVVMKSRAKMIQSYSFAQMQVEALRKMYFCRSKITYECLQDAVTQYEEELQEMMESCETQKSTLKNNQSDSRTQFLGTSINKIRSLDKRVISMEKMLLESNQLLSCVEQSESCISPLQDSIYSHEISVLSQRHKLLTARYRVFVSKFVNHQEEWKLINEIYQTILEWLTSPFLKFDFNVAETKIAQWKALYADLCEESESSPSEDEEEKSKSEQLVLQMAHLPRKESVQISYVLKMKPILSALADPHMPMRCWMRISKLTGLTALDIKVLTLERIILYNIDVLLEDEMIEEYIISLRNEENTFDSDPDISQKKSLYGLKIKFNNQFIVFEAKEPFFDSKKKINVPLNLIKAVHLTPSEVPKYINRELEAETMTFESRESAKPKTVFADGIRRGKWHTKNGDILFFFVEKQTSKQMEIRQFSRRESIISGTDDEIKIISKFAVSLSLKTTDDLPFLKFIFSLCGTNIHPEDFKYKVENSKLRALK